jgi:hypothetical protein
MASGSSSLSCPTSKRQGENLCQDLIGLQREREREQGRSLPLDLFCMEGKEGKRGKKWARVCMAKIQIKFEFFKLG